MHALRVIFVAILLALWGTLATVLFAQQPTTQSDVLQVVAVAGCLEQSGDDWILTSATPPLFEPTADGDAQTGSAITVRKANAQPPGKERYRLMGLLHEFGVAEHLGHKVLVKGLIVGDAEERRINLASFEMAAQECGDEK